MHPGQRLRDRKSQPRAPLRPVELRPHLLKRPANARHELARDAGPIVLDEEVHRFPGARNPETNHSGPLRGELDRVVEDLREDLVQGPLVGLDVASGLNGAHQRDAFCSGALCDGGHGVADDLGHVDGGRGERHVTGFDPRNLKDVVDDGEQVEAAAADVAGVVAVAFIAERAEHLALHHLGEPDDGVQWRAQLVAHLGQEVALRSAGALRLALLLVVALG